ncbi:hypothetical protein K1W54_07440 [Micromonospora sp. CPCC 205371]|nr:hypothetical protein [Micromonospora sp. CPCC 205371]
MSLPVDDLIGRELRDSDYQPVGKITAVYQYPTDMNAPGGAAAVTYGLIRKSTRLVDLEQAELDGEAIWVPHTMPTITSAPNFSPLVGNMLAEPHALEVRSHYWGAAQFA